MSHLGILAYFLLLQVTVAPAQEPDQTTTPKYDEGPLRTEVTAMREIRLEYLEDAGRSQKESNFAMQVRVRGERLGEIVRFGNLILTEAVDDTGHVMIDDETFSEEEKTTLRSMSMPAERLSQTGLLVTTHGNLSTRGAKQIQKLRGTVRLIMAKEVEKITVLNPAASIGKTLENDRLKELGIEIRFAEASEVERLPSAACLMAQFKAKGEHVSNVSFFNGLMQPVRFRETPIKTASGEDCTAYVFDPAGFDNELQMVLEVHPTIEDIQLPLEVDNLDLP